MIAIISIITTVTAILVINTIYITIFIISVTFTIIIIIMMSPPLIYNLFTLVLRQLLTSSTFNLIPSSLSPI